MYTPSRFASAAVLFGLASSVLSAQSITSAHSGTVHYFEGAVTIDGAAIEAKKAKFYSLKDQSVLATGEGRAEILLTPGVFLRVGENSSVRMLDTRLLSTRVEFISGSAMVESDDPEVSTKDPAVTIVYRDYEIQPVKFGLFELFSAPSELKVFKGQAEVTAAGNRVVVKEGRLLPFSAALLTEKFDPKNADDLYLWTRDRGAYLSAANMTSARTVAALGPSGYAPMGMYGNRFGGSWYYNTFLDMYTFLPYGGTYWSPFGYGFFSPYSIYSYYNPGNYYWYGAGAPPTGGGSGQPVNSASQINRFGVAVNRPTLAAPIRGNVNGGAGPLRGGFSPNNGFQQPGPTMNPGYNAASAVPSSGAMSAGASRGGFSAPAAVSAPSAGPSAAPSPRAH